MRTWFVGGIIGVGILVALFFCFYPLHIVLTVTAATEGDTVLCAPMAEREEFVISFVHSVNKRPVYDTLRVEGDHLVIVKSRFDSFGAGMPYGSTTEGTLSIGKDGWFEWTINRPVSEVTVRVGRVAEHVLYLKGREIHLSDVAEPGKALSFRVEKGSFVRVLKGRCIR